MDLADTISLRLVNVPVLFHPVGIAENWGYWKLSYRYYQYSGGYGEVKLYEVGTYGQPGAPPGDVTTSYSALVADYNSFLNSQYHVSYFRLEAGPGTIYSPITNIFQSPQFDPNAGIGEYIWDLRTNTLVRSAPEFSEFIISDYSKV